MRRGWRGAVPACVLAATLAFSAPAFSETIETAPGIAVSKRDFEAPVNEVPFYGFRAKTPEQSAADAKFLVEIDGASGREAAARQLIQQGGQALMAGDLATAAKRYNQAFLVRPGAAEVYHGFAVIVAARFKDAAYADELFRIAHRLQPEEPQLLHDYSRFLMVEQRPAEALPLLEALVKHPKAGATNWNNLGFAYALTGQNPRACEAAKQAQTKSPRGKAQKDLEILRQVASCPAD